MRKKQLFKTVKGERTLKKKEKTLLNELRLINIALKRSMSAICDNGVPTVSSMVLHFVFMNGGNALQKDVENEFGMRRSTASQLLGKLENGGYITRAVIDSDGRSKRIYLSEKAVAEQNQVAQKLRSLETYLESALSAEEKNTFFKLSGKIRRKFEPNPENSRGGV